MFSTIRDINLNGCFNSRSQNSYFTHNKFHVYAFDMQGTVIGDGVRLRSAASNTSSVLELMYSGERVWIDSSYSNANWYRVIRQSTGRTGYVNWEYIQPDYAR